MKKKTRQIINKMSPMESPNREMTATALRSGLQRLPATISIMINRMTSSPTHPDRTWRDRPTFGATMAWGWPTLGPLVPSRRCMLCSQNSVGSNWSRGSPTRMWRTKSGSSTTTTSLQSKLYQSTRAPSFPESLSTQRPDSSSSSPRPMIKRTSSFPGRSSLRIIEENVTTGGRLTVSPASHVLSSTYPLAKT